MRIDRIKILQKSLQQPLLIKKPENLLYLTGRSFMHGYLLVKPSGSPVFFGDGLEKVEGIKSDFLKNVGKYVGPEQALEVFSEFTYAEVRYIKYKNPHLKVKVTVKHDPVDVQREVKDKGEIALVKKSMQIVEQVFAKVKEGLRKKKWTEQELAAFIKQEGLRLGAEGVSFPPIVASGPNAAVPHHVPGSKPLRPGETIILDFGFKYKNYCSDFTRTVFLGSAPKNLADAYNQVEKAYNESINLVSLGGKKGFGSPAKQSNRIKELSRSAPSGSVVTGNDAYQKSVDVLAEKKLDKYFIHSLGHGTGLEIHELPNLSPKSKDVLTDGMVFSIEPGVYLPKAGGIRIEDLVYMEKGVVKKFIDVSTKLEDNII